MLDPYFQRKPGLLAKTGLFVVAPGAGDLQSRMGRRLRRLRRDYNLSRACIATKVGVTQAFLSDVEAGRKAISLRLLHEIAKVLEMNLSELLQDV